MSHMAAVLAQYPEVKATFNFVPCLVEQIQEYAHDGAVDRALARGTIATNDAPDFEPQET